MTIKQAQEKLVAMPERFMECFRRKDYSQALHIYKTALTVAVFLELPEDQKTKLFGSRQQDPQVDGLFPESMVQKCIELTEIKRRDEREMILWDKFCRQYGLK